MTAESGREPRNTDVPGHASPEKWYADHHREFWWTVATVWIGGTVVLGFWGWCLTDPSGSFWDHIYSTLQLFWLQGSFDSASMSWQLEVARFAGAVVLLSTVSLAFFALFRTEVRRWRVRQLRGHTIVCGLGEKGFQAVRALRDVGEQVVVILLDAENDRLPAARALGALELIADATEEETLIQAGIARASQLLVLCNEDKVNVAVAQAARRIAGEQRDRQVREGSRRRSLACKVLISDEVWWRQLDPLKITARSDAIVVEYLNLIDRAAQQLIIAFPPSAARAGEGPGVARAAVVGDGELARAVCAELVKRWGSPRVGEPRLELHLWCGRADALMKDLQYDYGPSLDADGHVTIIPVPDAAPLGEPASTHAELCSAVPPLEGIDRVYVCLGADHRSVAVSLVIGETGKAAQRGHTNVTACLANAGALGQVLAGGGVARDGAHVALSVFDIMRAVRDPELLFVGFHEALARSIHARYCKSNPGRPASVPWVELSEEDREQNRQLALNYGRYLQGLGCEVTRRRALADRTLAFTAAELDEVAAEEHARWWQSRVDAGWEYGEARDDSLKKHPLMKPWGELTAQERELTLSEMREIPEILAEAGFHVFRAPPPDLSTEVSGD